MLKTPDFQPADELKKALLSMSKAMVLPEIISLLKEGRSIHSREVRILALTILAEMKLDYCLQEIIEYLPSLPQEETRIFGTLLAKWHPESFKEKAGLILAHPDSAVRASIIYCLPYTGDSGFIKDTAACLKDPDPDIRIAAVWALVDFNDSKALNKALDLLLDPQDRVRVQAARALSEAGDSTAFKKLSEIFFSRSEPAAVISSIIEGLSFSENTESIPLLVKKLEEENCPEDELVAALSRKTEKKEAELLLEYLKNAEARIKNFISKAFAAMGEQMEAPLSAILKEGLSYLKPYIAEIFEETGYVDKKIRLLSHRDPLVRRASAGFLSLLDSKAAFRGIVMAARDPDEEVRVLVVKALEKLAGPDCASILQELNNDPDQRIRKYTAWAMERLEAKAL
jgi:HEAT repeat protein